MFKYERDAQSEMDSDFKDSKGGQKVKTVKKRKVESQGIGEEREERTKKQRVEGGEKAYRGHIYPGLNYYHYCNDSVMFSFLDQ